MDIQWDDSGCLGAVDFQIAYGFGSQLPTSPGGAFALQPASLLQQCNIPGSPRIWSGVPDPAIDSTRLLYFLMLANDDQGVEGSWGKDSGTLERVGPSAGGSGQCGNSSKSLVNTCGH